MIVDFSTKELLYIKNYLSKPNGVTLSMNEYGKEYKVFKNILNKIKYNMN